MKKKKISINSYISSAIFLAFISSTLMLAPISKICYLYLNPLKLKNDLGSNFFIFLVIFYITMKFLKKSLKPIDEFLKYGKTEFKEKAIEKYNSLYIIITKHILIIYSIFLLYGLYGLVYIKGETLRYYILAFLIPTFSQMYYLIYFTIIYLEPVLFTKVADKFYDKKDIYKRKTGLAFKIHTKIFLTILNLVIIPMILIALIIKFNIKKDIYIYLTILFPLFYLISYSEMLYRSISKPINELIKKMERLSKGDFDVKTTVLSDDEIGILKAYFNDMIDALKEREQLKDTFGKYVSVEIAKQLIESGNIELGGENVEATILFSDIRNFTSISENLTAKEVVDFLNEYFSYITKPIMENNGIINKFIGDAVMAIFAPQFGSSNYIDDSIKKL